MLEEYQDALAYPTTEIPEYYADGQWCIDWRWRSDHDDRIRTLTRSSPLDTALDGVSRDDVRLIGIRRPVERNAYESGSETERRIRDPSNTVVWWPPRIGTRTEQSVQTHIELAQ